MIVMRTIEKYDRYVDTRQAEYAIAVAEELNFTRAARRVHAVQSTVSAGVRALERELGADLFERDARAVRLTPAGEAALPALRELVEAAARARQSADPAGELRGELRVGIFPNLPYLDLPAIVGAYRRAHPLVDLQLRTSSSGSAGLADDVRHGRLDLALFGLPATSVPGLRVRRITTSPFVAVLPAGHPLAGRPRLYLADLADEPFVDTPEGFGNRVTLDAALAARGILRSVPTEVAEIGAIALFIAAGMGVAALPEMTVPPTTGAVVVPLADRVDWELNVVTRPAPRSAVEAFLDLFPAPR